MNSKQSYCLVSRHYSQTVNQNVFEKVNHRTKKNYLKLSREFVVIAEELKVKFFISKRLEEKSFLKREDVKINTVRLCQVQRGLI